MTDRMQILRLLAPVSGPLLPLEEVPDPVFAEKMVGDGVSIDPVTSTLLSPCDAEILSIHPSGHAVTLRTPERIELILHIGLDTVTLRGEGFLPLRKKGDNVRAGEPLIDFAADYVAQHAPSLLTQMVISTTDRVALLKRGTGYAEAGRDVVVEATLVPDVPAAHESASAAEILSSPELLVRNPTGLHARPAAVLANAARKFRADLRVRRGAHEANARSVTSLMALEIAPGDRIVVTASGNDAREALETLVPLVESGLGEESTDITAAAAADASLPAAAATAGFESPDCLRGVGASPGIAIGRAFVLAAQELPPVQPVETPADERRKLEDALAAARRQLDDLSQTGPAAQAGIFHAHRELLEDPDLLDSSVAMIAEGTGAAAAWHRAFTLLADRMATARSSLFAQRAADVRDVGRRVLRILTGTDNAPVYPDDAIVIAEELTPSDAAGFERAHVRGFCTVTGGTTSHVAILARAMGIPAVAAIDARAVSIAAGTPLILDGTDGLLVVDPSDRDLAAAQAAISADDARRRAAAAAAGEPALTRDGVRIEVAANIGQSADLAGALAHGAEGVGLLRSEFLFLDRQSAPDEDEQYEAYADVAKAFRAATRVIIRTLDVGGDKPLPYLPLPREENPFLGIRGIRLTALRRDLFRAQLRAILRASSHGPVNVMFPMVATIEDWRLARDLLEQERAALDMPRIPVGIMVEVPSVALIAERFAREVDFFSIGTNDLTQYALAMDRGHPALAAQVDALHPAVLQLIERTAAAARAHGKWTGVCGAIAGDEAAVPILIGLGVTELSTGGPSIPSIKARIRSLDLRECRTLARAALEADTAADVRALVRS
jgi:phosphocarrier protein FPr